MSRFDISRSGGIISVMFFIILVGISTGWEKESPERSHQARREETVRRLAQRAEKAKSEALERGRQEHWQIRGQRGHRIYEWMAVINNRPIYWQTCNLNSAISHGVDLIRNIPPYSVNGAGFTVGIWDAGSVRSSHQELVGRVTLQDSVANNDHSTHVAGTIGAAGVVANAQGMAPAVAIDSYDWGDDLSEMAARAAAYPGEPGMLYVSNHSYGAACGWEADAQYWLGHPGWYWMGQWNDREDELFGRYWDNAVEYDSICYENPCFLPFWAAGNDRNDSAPPEGTKFYYYDGKWRSKSYNSATDPYSDNYDNGGYDTILPSSAAKNIVTVGAVNDAVQGDLRNPANGTMTVFSGWGPTDDGRVKPDLVCNGYTLYSSTALHNSSYATYSGTSMATPGAAGAAILLAELYGRLSGGGAMLSSTLKALLIHTADDLGNPGPDYQYGWGLLNAHAAADHISDFFAADCGSIIESQISAGDPMQSYAFQWDQQTPIRATLCWTDPPAAEVTGLDNPSPCLVNDLDLRIIAPDGLTVYLPYVLNPAVPSADAASGDNVLDNVEQVDLPFPSMLGTYTVQVTCKLPLTDGLQEYSLLISGQNCRPDTLDHFRWEPIDSPRPPNVPFAATLTARDSAGQIVADFEGSAELTAWAGFPDTELAVGDGSVPEEYPISVYYKTRRTQSIYDANEIGQTGTVSHLALFMDEPCGRVRTNWTIRMKHTELDAFPAAEWQETGWTVVYEANEPPGQAGWQYYLFSTPFEYDGLRNLMVDFSFQNDDRDDDRGYAYSTQTTSNRTVGYYTDAAVQPPTQWSGSQPGAYLYDFIPTIALVMEGSLRQIALDPNVADFTEGAWDGQLLITEQASDVFLVVDDGNGHTGQSNRFDVAGIPPAEPNLPLPENHAVDVPIDTWLSWQQQSPGISFDVYIGHTDPPAEMLCADANEPSCDPNLACSAAYFWQVIAKNEYGNTPGPVWTFNTQSLAGDIDENCRVGITDLLMLSDRWLSDSSQADLAPPEGDGIVNCSDLAILAENWLKTLFE